MQEILLWGVTQHPPPLYKALMTMQSKTPPNRTQRNLTKHRWPQSSHTGKSSPSKTKQMEFPKPPPAYTLYTPPTLGHVHKWLGREAGTSDEGPVTLLLSPSFHEGCWQSTNPTATNTFKGAAEPMKMAAVWSRESFSNTIFDEGWPRRA